MEIVEIILDVIEIAADIAMESKNNEITGEKHEHIEKVLGSTVLPHDLGEGNIRGLHEDLRPSKMEGAPTISKSGVKKSTSNEAKLQESRKYGVHNGNPIISRNGVTRPTSNMPFADMRRALQKEARTTPTISKSGVSFEKNQAPTTRKSESVKPVVKEVKPIVEEKTVIEEVKPIIEAKPIVEEVKPIVEEKPEPEYNERGFNKRGYHKNGTRRDDDGYDAEGYSLFGYDRDGYDRTGYNHLGYDRNGYNKDGYDREGFNREGYDRFGGKRQ